MYRYLFKRVFDFTISLVSILVLLPFYLVISLLIKFDTKGSVFFRQNRLGKNGKVFRIFKFRTMVTNAESIGTGLFTDGNDTRITKVGAFLRKFSLDEVPQLINILKGDMSLIGPRPPVPYHPYEYNEYPEKYKVRFNYKPGITGWAQVHGRTNLTWPQRLELDCEYHNNFSLILDVKIVFLTIYKILKMEDVYPDDINVGKQHKN
ncbi:MAG TPA: sugar transferase [Tenuifilaceae bacterium]|nr:sugar transferase [Tenuifilaceae bacterium]